MSKRNNKNTDNNDLTTGSIVGKIIMFAVPIFLGNLFQQLYNTVDALIVGQFIGDEALAAVTSIGSLSFLLVGFFNGTANGAGVIISKYFGAKNEEGVERSVHTAIAFGLLCGLLMTVVGFFLAPQILTLMDTPTDVFHSSEMYLRVYFLGSIALVMYNVCMGILQAVGDSRHPLYYLMISSCVNVALDLLFCGLLGRGVEFAALATVISQFFSVMLCLRRLTHTREVYRVTLKKVRFDLPMLKQIVHIGLPSGLQNSIISIANVFVQSNINAFGKYAMAGSGAYFKLEGFGFLPITCFALASTTYISQNLGAKRYDRVKKGVGIIYACSLILAEVIGLVMYLLMPYMLGWFTESPEAIEYGLLHAHVTTLFYFLLAYSHISAGILRGAGKSTVPMFVMLGCWCIFRISYIEVITHISDAYQAVISCYPVTWSLSTIIFTIYLLKSDWIHNWERKEAKE